MTIIEPYILLFILVLVINVVPAFMPPTWVVLSFLYIQFNLAFIPTVIVGVIAATAGRVLLALMARYWFKRFFPKKLFGNYEKLGNFLNNNQKLTIPIVFGYAFSPISSNSLFIVAGLSEVKLNLIAFSFFIGRMMSYSFWITASRRFSNRIEDIFAGHFSNLGSIIGLLFSILVIIIIGKVNWTKILHTRRK